MSVTHGTALPWYEPPNPAHSSSVRGVQKECRQHAPVVHGLGAQSVPAPCHSAGAGQAESTTASQEPSGWQQAPTGGHEFG